MIAILLLDLTDFWDDWHSERNVVYDYDGEIVDFNGVYIKGKRDWWVTAVSYSAFCKWINQKIVRAFREMGLLGFSNYAKIIKESKRAKAVIITFEEGIPDHAILEYDGLLMLRGEKRKSLIDENWKRTAKYLLNIRDLFREKNIPMILVMYPHGIYMGEDEWSEGREPWGFERNKVYKDYYAFNLVEQFAKKNDIPFINTLNDFLTTSENGKFFYDYDGHMTPSGYNVVGKGIYTSSVFRDELKKFMPYVVFK